MAKRSINELMENAGRLTQLSESQLQMVESELMDSIARENPELASRIESDPLLALAKEID